MTTSENIPVRVQICCKSINRHVSGHIHVVIKTQQATAPLQILHLSTCTIKVFAGLLVTVKEISLHYIVTQKTYNLVILILKNKYKMRLYFHEH